MKKLKINSAKPIAIEDGVTHINIGGATALGSKLTHFAHTPIDHYYFGKFNCIEGLWHYLKDPEHKDIFRTMNGKKAKAAGKNFSRRVVNQFIDVIIAANVYKLQQHPEVMELMMTSTLPFKNYYFSGELNLVTEAPNAAWMCRLMETVRDVCQGKREFPVVDYTTVL